MTAPHPGGPDPQVVALARDVERTRRRLGDVEALLRALADQIAALTPDEDTTPPPVWSWLLVDDAEQARAALADLAEWVAAVYLRYPDAALPSCWAFHPHAVEELHVLREQHRAAFGAAGSWRDVGDWHDRHRPGVVRRLDALTRCELALHLPGGEQDRPASRTPLAEATDEMAQRWTASRSTPTPTPEQLAEAERHDRARHSRTSR